MFSRYREALLLKLVMIYNSLVNYTSVSKIEVFFFFLCLFPLNIVNCWVLSSLIRQMGKTLLACVEILIF